MKIILFFFFGSNSDKKVSIKRFSYKILHMCSLHNSDQIGYTNELEFGYINILEFITFF